MKSREGHWRRVKAGRECDGTRGVPTVIAYGDGSFASSAKGAMAAPTSALRRSCVAVFGAANVVVVGEYFTSQKHASTPKGAVCGEFLQDVVDKRVGHAKRASCGGSGGALRSATSGVVVRGLKRCVTWGGDACRAANTEGSPTPHASTGGRCPTCHQFEDRDANACRSLLAVFWSQREGRARPQYLRPPAEDQRQKPQRGAGVAAGRPVAYNRRESTRI